MIYYTFYSFFIWKLLMFLHIFLKECEKCTVIKNRILELEGALKEHLTLTLYCPWVKLRPFGSSLGPESCLLKNMENSWLLTPFLSSVPKSGEGVFSSSVGDGPMWPGILEMEWYGWGQGKGKKNCVCDLISMEHHSGYLLKPLYSRMEPQVPHPCRILEALRKIWKVPLASGN